MGFISLRTLRAISAILLGHAALPACEKTVYLTLDTGSMGPAEAIAQILVKHRIRATFFIANEKTTRGDFSMDAAWAPFWKARAEEGHAFGNHTFRHWYFRRDLPNGRVAYVGREGRSEELDRAGICRELKKSEEAFRALTGRGYDPIWRAPGGKTTPFVLKAAKSCGYEHAGWSQAGLLGDELPSQAYPNRKLLAKALAEIRDGDILLMHLGIRSRKDPFWPMLDPLIAGLKAKGFCFAPLTERKSR